MVKVKGIDPDSEIASCRHRLYVIHQNSQPHQLCDLELLSGRTLCIRHDRGRWGGDVGLNYFVTRYIGIGGDAEMPDNGGNLVDQVLGSLIIEPDSPTAPGPGAPNGKARWMLS